MIEIKRSNGRTSAGCETDDVGAFPREMGLPALPTRVKQRRRFLRVRVHGMRPVRLVQVTARAGQGEVVIIIGSAACERNNVLDMKRRPLKRLAHATIFATVFRTLFNPRGQGCWKAHAGSRPRSCKAWARSSEISSLSAARAASSSFSRGCRRPSVFRSIKFCSCRSVSGGSRKSLMDSINDAGASMVAGIRQRCEPPAVCQCVADCHTSGEAQMTFPPLPLAWREC